MATNGTSVLKPFSCVPSDSGTTAEGSVAFKFFDDEACGKESTSNITDTAKELPRLSGEIVNFKGPTPCGRVITLGNINAKSVQLDWSGSITMKFQKGDYKPSATSSGCECSMEGEDIKPKQCLVVGTYPIWEGNVVMLNGNTPTSAAEGRRKVRGVKYISVFMVLLYLIL
ncbi:hypothetical protein HDU92_000026 [Lobulomyces angularis]|nr:hypothetical protein HDU92_000026 [Lobulomyces angularis]